MVPSNLTRFQPIRAPSRTHLEPGQIFKQNSKRVRERERETERERERERGRERQREREREREREGAGSRRFDNRITVAPLV